MWALALWTGSDACPEDGDDDAGIDVVVVGVGGAGADAGAVQELHRMDAGDPSHNATTTMSPPVVVDGVVLVDVVDAGG